MLKRYKTEDYPKINFLKNLFLIPILIIFFGIVILSIIGIILLPLSYTPYHPVIDLTPYNWFIEPFVIFAVLGIGIAEMIDELWFKYLIKVRKENLWKRGNKNEN